MVREEPGATPESVETIQPAPTAGNGKGILRVKDPQGYEIALDLITWEKHIITGHPEMQKFLDQISKTLQEPQVIQRASHVSTTYYYYRLTGRSFYRCNDIYVSVVVQRDDATKTGFVKTAHLLRKLREEEKLYGSEGARAKNKLRHKE